LEYYRDLFVRSGAWQRMTDYFEKQKSRPLYVLDLNREIEYIKEWYDNRFLELDEYFGITDGADGLGAVRNNRQPAANGQSPVFNLSGQEIPNGQQKGIYVAEGRKYLVK
jgi:hypothetical protein